MIGWEYLKTIVIARKHNTFKITPNVGCVGTPVTPLEMNAPYPVQSSIKNLFSFVLLRFPCLAE